MNTNYQHIKKLVENGDFLEAVAQLKKSIDLAKDSKIIKEYVYLKRLASISFNGADLIYLMKASDKNELIESKINEYRDCINIVLKNLDALKIDSPLAFLKKNTPTMNGLVEARKSDFETSVFFDSTIDKKYYSYSKYFEKNYGHNSVYDTFDELSDKCYEGIIFDKYPDQIEYCREIFPLSPQSFYAVWTNCPRDLYVKLLADGKKIKEIVVFKSALWKWNWFKKKRHEPDFSELNSFKYVEPYPRGRIETKNIELEYTGRNHSIQNIILYEVNIKVNRQRCFRGGFYEYSENPFSILLKAIYREAENILRQNNGLPKIGEGWISEMLLYNLIKTYFPETIHQTRPDWIKPQHLDIYVLNKKIAFEYQGRQHFEPVEFFGGEETFEKQKKLDYRKITKCKNKNVKLIYWRYDEPISEEILIEKLEQHSIKIPNSLCVKKSIHR